MDLYIDSVFEDLEPLKSDNSKKIEPEINKSVQPNQEVIKPIETNKSPLHDEDLFANPKSTEVTKTHDELTKEDELFNSKKHDVASLFPEDNKSSLFGDDKPVDNKVEVKEPLIDDNKSSLFGDAKPVEPINDSLFGDSGSSLFGSHKKSTLFDDDVVDKAEEAKKAEAVRKRAEEEAKKKLEDDVRKKRAEEEAKKKADEEAKKKAAEEEAKKKKSS